ncbi:MAG: hypothetical protein JRN62_04355 [Nitrososphaerota archaeon]|jgi:hypothetical protein|nr:hypothetical protein [Nitrososphaerota archaeon]MDG6948835.1 hypothetical protein [Nitrososphaerota archaeon]
MKSLREWFVFSEGEARFIDSLDINRLQMWIFPLIAAFAILGAIDASMTTVALRTIQGATELNPIAAMMFRFGFAGSVLALGLKYAVPLPTMMYVFSLNTRQTVYETRQAKFLKLAIVAALFVGVGWWGFAVGFDLPSFLIGMHLA